jgi:hypothetical protein
MREDIFNHVTLKDGKILNYNGLNPDDLTDSVKSELAQIPASQLDILYIRKNIHAHGDALQSISGNLGIIQKDVGEITKALDKALYVEIVNGKKTKKLISEIIAEMYQRESLRRDFSKLFQMLGRHKKVLYTVLISIIIVNLFFGGEIKVILDLAREHLWSWITSIFGIK